MGRWVSRLAMVFVVGLAGCSTARPEGGTQPGPGEKPVASTQDAAVANPAASGGTPATAAAPRGEIRGRILAGRTATGAGWQVRAVPCKEPDDIAPRSPSLEEAVAHFEREERWRRDAAVETLTDADGRFHLKGLRGPHQSLEVVDPKGVLQFVRCDHHDTVGGAVQLVAVGADVRLRATPMASVELRFVEASGEVAEPGQFSLGSKILTWWGKPLTVWLPVGYHRVSAQRHAAWQVPDHRFKLTEGTRDEPLRIVVTPRRRISGLVPVEGRTPYSVEVRWASLDDPDRRGSVHVWEGAYGWQFRIFDLPPGRYRLEARLLQEAGDRSWWDWRSVLPEVDCRDHTQSVSFPPFETHLEGAHEVKVLAPDGTVLGDAMVRAWAPVPVGRHTPGMWVPELHCHLLEEGSVLAGPDGKQQLVVEHPDHGTLQLPVEVVFPGQTTCQFAAAQPLRVQLQQLPRGVSASDLDLRLEPVEGVVDRERGMGVLHGTWESDESFLFGAVQPGRYRLWVTRGQPGDADFWQLSVAEVAIPGTTELAVTLPEMGSLQVRCEGKSPPETLTLWSQDSGWWECRASRRDVPVRNGVALFEHLPAGIYALGDDPDFPHAGMRIAVQGQEMITWDPVMPAGLLLLQTHRSGALMATGFRDGDRILAKAGVALRDLNERSFRAAGDLLIDQAVNSLVPEPDPVTAWTVERHGEVMEVSPRRQPGVPTELMGTLRLHPGARLLPWFAPR